MDFEEDTGDIHNLIPNKFYDKIEHTLAGLRTDYGEQSTNTGNSTDEIPLKALDWLSDRISPDNSQNFETKEHEGFFNTTSENLPNLSNAGK